jgi:flagellar P-ring protein precursor FlgI
MLTALAAWLLGAWLCAGASAARIKDITTIEGVRPNQLVGFGLVVGLAGTGGGSDFTAEMAENMLERLRVGRGLSELDADNMSAVMVTAELPPFGRKGNRIDVTVSAIDEASSLRGGTLLLTPLAGADGRIYAVSQGAVMVGGFNFGGQAAAVQKGHPTVGRIPNGATIEKTVPCTFIEDGAFTLCLNTPDFKTARDISLVIEEAGHGTCTIEDAGTVRVALGPGAEDAVNEAMMRIAHIQALKVKPDAPAVVVINEKTGTIVAGSNVGISRVAISHGNLTVVTEEKPQVSQPNELSPTGETVVVPRTEVNVVEESTTPGGLTVVPEGTTVADVARALNALGAGPQDMISIFQAIKEAGALHAELRIM